MADVATERHPIRLLAVSAGLLVAALLLTLFHLRNAELIGVPEPTGMAQAILEDSALPRVAVALLAGAMLGLSGALFQHILDNPLAEPTTLGVSGGAYLAMALVTLLLPDLSGGAREAAALAGALMASGLVLALSWTRALSGSAVLMSGLVLALLCGSLGSIVTVLHHDYLDSVSLWSSGVLDQSGWDVACGLSWRFGVSVAVAGLLSRPLAVLGLDDAVASSLGIALRAVRLTGLALAALLAGSVVSAVGVIAFIGLAAPWVARLAGARRPGSGMLWASLLGGLLLWLVDAAVQCGDGVLPDLPTGAATAALGCPLLVLVLRAPRAGLAPRSTVQPASSRASGHLAAVLLALPIVVALLSIAVGRGPLGWEIEGWQGVLDLMPYRGPRLAAAGTAGAMMAGAGVLLQRVTGNPLAAPELLGIAPGVALGVIGGLISGVPAGFWFQSMAGLVGGCTVLATAFLLGRKHGFQPDRMLLGGVALGTAVSAVLTLLTTVPDPRFGAVLFWMAGATDYATPPEVRSVVVLAIPSLLAGLLALRWLAILPLGDDVAIGMGVDLSRARLTLFGLAAVLTTGATLVIGPLSFVGLMAPHMARQLGLTRPFGHYAGSVALGIIVMFGADWLGRTLLFPYAIPAGLLASLFGAPYVLFSMWKQPR